MSDNQLNIISQWVMISIKKVADEDYLSLTDIAKFKNPEFPADVIKNWMRNKHTLEFLGIRERLYNPLFKLVEFDQFKEAAGYNSFVLSPQKRIASTSAIWLLTKSGHGWWTFAHKDIAIEFAWRISVEFRLYLIKDFQRLKDEEQKRVTQERSLSRAISKINYKIHTDAIKEHLIPQKLTPEEITATYISEADMLNKILFGKTAHEWKHYNAKSWNIRDYATIQQLIVLSNMESINALLIEKWLSQIQRIKELHRVASSQMKSLLKIISWTSLHQAKQNPNIYPSNLVTHADVASLYL